MNGKLIVNISKINQNIRHIKSQTKGAMFCAVVKAACYGVGLPLCKHIANQVDYWAVSNKQEAYNVCRYSNKPVLILTPISKADIYSINKHSHNIEYTVDNMETLMLLIANRVYCNIHIAVNTGMNRYGTDYNTYKNMLDVISGQQIVKLVGVFSHFYKNTKMVMHKQYKRFLPFIRLAKQYDKNIICHISNSGGTQYHLDMVRVGIGLYSPNNFDCLKLIGYIKHIREIDKHESVGYNANYVARQKTKVAVVSLGYADGILRKQGGGHVIINNIKCKIIGDICMDCFMVDVTNIVNVKIGDKVTILGKMHKQCINICKVASKCDTISYEILTRLGNRIKRVYKHASDNREV